MYARNRGFMKDMNRADLLKMREEQEMSNQEIADTLGCSYETVRSIIGKQPPGLTKKNRQNAAARAAANRLSDKKEGRYSVERKMQSFMPWREEEPVCEAVLAVKSAPIILAGAFMDYAVSADRKMIEVEKEGRVLFQIPAENLEQFICELKAINRNISEVKPMAFWG